MDWLKEGWTALASHLDGSWWARLGRALLEVVVVSVIGLAPLVAAAFLNNGRPMSGDQEELGRLIGAGQLFLYCFAYVGTNFWLLIRAVRKTHIFVSAWWGLILLLTAGSCLWIFGQKPEMDAPLPAHLVSLSKIELALCVVTYFFLLMCDSADPNLDRSMRRDVNNLISKAGLS